MMRTKRKKRAKRTEKRKLPLPLDPIPYSELPSVITHKIAMLIEDDMNTLNAFCVTDKSNFALTSFRRYKLFNFWKN